METSRKRNWLFQANPDRYRIVDSLRIEPDEWWNLNQHASEVSVGDNVAIWLSGENAGLYALGSVAEGPIKMADSERGQSYWKLEEDGKKVKPRVRVTYHRVITDRPLLKTFLLLSPEFRNLRVIRSPRGTNFVLDDVEWSALVEWIDDVA